MLGRENNSSSTSALDVVIDAGEIEEKDSDLRPMTPTVMVTCKKRKRSSFKGPMRMTEKVREDIRSMLKAVPKIDELFTVVDKIGEGTFSSVYRATLKKAADTSQEFALKHIIPTSHPDRILSELSCLVKIGGCHNVMGVKLTVREKDNIVIVMPHFKHNRFQDFYHDMTVEEVQDYLRALFTALRRVHRFNVIHRDVKPGNFLYDRQSRKYALVDFGLAQAVPTISTLKASGKKSTLGGVLHHDTPRPPLARKNTRRAASASENKVPSRVEPKRTQSESLSKAPRLVELDPNTFHSTDKSSRDRSNHKQDSINEDDLKKNVTTTIARGSENTGEGVVIAPPKEKKPTKPPKPVVLTRNCAAITTRGVAKKTQEVPKTPQGVCRCYGLPQVCDVCMARKNQAAPRAGTPGFRSPEVLLKCPDQTTAVDIWAAGVIFLSILSGRYPFFRAPDDCTALAQIMSIMGTEETTEAAKANGKNLLCNVKLPAMELKTMCRQLRLGAIQSRHTKSSQSNGESSKRRRRSVNQTSPPKDEAVVGSPGSLRSEGSVGSEEGLEDRFPDSAYDLLGRLLELDPHKRITAEQALKHPFLVEAV
ncbi:cell division cycle 7-related protein kinase-like [Lytechinus pictus]|uniref:cell division cycle 7-related protein kinase-like n=1 Tax=Lytechinus pictus TaxID=7653 RepID=UPI0030BA1D39